MSLRFMLGRSGTGKSERMMNEIIERLTEDPAGEPIIYLVPDQMTFQSEYKLSSAPGMNGMIRAQVFSFSRLAWKVLGDMGGMTRTHITSTGIHMMLRKIIEHRREELRIFKKSSDQTGFYELLELMMTELKRYCITPDEVNGHASSLQYFAGKESTKNVLQDKLSDLGLIYNELENALAANYVDSEDYLRLLVEKIPHSPYIRECEIYIDGFHSFTPQEKEVLAMLMKYAKKVTVALTGDVESHHAAPHELDLFHMTSSTFIQLVNMAKENGVKIEENVLLATPERFKSPALLHLERHFDTRPEVKSMDTEGLKLYSAVSLRAEAEGAAREILRLVRDEMYRFRDISISVRNSASYQSVIETVFEEYEIPVFVDQKKSMLHHPLVELIRSVLDIISKNWRYEAVFRAVKTDLLYPGDRTRTVKELRKGMDQLENYCLALGIQGSRWTDPKPWKYVRIRGLEEGEAARTDSDQQKENELNELREIIVAPIKRLSRDFKTGKTVRDYCAALFYFLERMEIPAKLDALRLKAEENDRLKEAREHGQVWNAVLNLLDEMVEMTGDEEIPLSLWTKMLDTGLESMKFSLVPPALDQVLVGTVDRSRFTDVKVHFLLGVNEGVLPARPKEGGLLSESDREMLEQNGLELAPSSRRQLLDEQFLIYLSLTNASDKLYVSYPLADEEGKTLQPSMVIARLHTLFPEMKERLWNNEPEWEDDLEFIQHPRKAVAYLNGKLREWKRGYGMADVWWSVYNWSLENKDIRHFASTVMSGLFFKNQEERLERSIAEELYGSTISASISRMEMFSSCPFSQFASYGLKLKEREIYRLEAPDIGQLFHAALKNMNDFLDSRGMKWQDLSQNEAFRIAGDMVELLAPKLQHEILLSSNRLLYIKRKLKDVVGKATFILSEHARASGFAPAGLELGFGRGGELPPLVYDLPNGTKMEIIGRIDRVDTAKSNSGLMLRVIDYKSSSTGLNLSEVYYGIALQMLTYLDVAVTHSSRWLGEEAVPAGVLYFHVHNPLLANKKLMTLEEIQKEAYRKFKMKGLVLAEEEAIGLMDHTMDKKSDIIPVELTQKGFHKRSSIATKEQFHQLRGFVKKTVQQIGTEISEGHIAISPYDLKNKKPCTFCSYKSVCQFDESFEDNSYRQLKNEKDDIILERICEEGGEAN
ncbi:helicase-exonuclease AddAB subunit AddB [Fictibacillus iocasae]|uniref:ATP-dependent helicase/deoxyribonuclease subunit B n=1 Tax=Fictibacillus iocasae TaxID=2715437 RepID=A0ABW2NM56_9BACL